MSSPESPLTCTTCIASSCLADTSSNYLQSKRPSAAPKSYMISKTVAVYCRRQWPFWFTRIPVRDCSRCAEQTPLDPPPSLPSLPPKEPLLSHINPASFEASDGRERQQQIVGVAHSTPPSTTEQTEPYSAVNSSLPPLTNASTETVLHFSDYFQSSKNGTVDPLGQSPSPVIKPSLSTVLPGMGLTWNSGSHTTVLTGQHQLAV